MNKYLNCVKIIHFINPDFKTTNVENKISYKASVKYCSQLFVVVIDWNSEETKHYLDDSVEEFVNTMTIKLNNHMVFCKYIE